MGLLQSKEQSKREIKNLNAEDPHVYSMLLLELADSTVNYIEHSDTSLYFKFSRIKYRVRYTDVGRLTTDLLNTNVVNGSKGFNLMLIRETMSLVMNKGLFPPDASQAQAKPEEQQN